MTKNELIDEVTKAEGKKQALSRAQIAEVVKIIGDMAKKNSKVIAALLK